MGVASAILGSAGLGFIGSALGSKSQSKAAGRAAESQVAAGDRAAQAQLNMYYQSRRDMTPWRIRGARGLQKFEDSLPDYLKSIKQYENVLREN